MKGENSFQTAEKRMNIRRFGIIAGVVIIVLAMFTVILGHAILPDNKIIPVVGIIFIILGLIFSMTTIIMDNRDRKQRRRQEEEE